MPGTRSLPPRLGSRVDAVDQDPSRQTRTRHTRLTAAKTVEPPWVPWMRVQLPQYGVVPPTSRGTSVRAYAAALPYDGDHGNASGPRPVTRHGRSEATSRSEIILRSELSVTASASTTLKQSSHSARPAASSAYPAPSGPAVRPTVVPRRAVPSLTFAQPLEFQERDRPRVRRPAEDRIEIPRARSKTRMPDGRDMSSPTGRASRPEAPVRNRQQAVSHDREVRDDAEQRQPPLRTASVPLLQDRSRAERGGGSSRVPVASPSWLYRWIGYRKEYAATSEAAASPNVA